MENVIVIKILREQQMEVVSLNVVPYNIEIIEESANVLRDFGKIPMDNADQLIVLKELDGMPLCKTASISVEHLKYLLMDIVFVKLAIKKIMPLENVFLIVQETRFELEAFVNVLLDIGLLRMVCVFLTVLQVVPMLMAGVSVKKIVELKQHLIAPMVSHSTHLSDNVGANLQKFGF